MKISPSPGRETMVGRKSESLSSLFQGLIRHLGISTSAVGAQLGGKGLAFVHPPQRRAVLLTAELLFQVFCPLLQPGLLGAEARGALATSGSGQRGKAEMCWGGSTPQIRVVEGVGGVHHPGPLHLLIQPTSEGVGKRVYFQRTCFPDPLASFHCSRCMRHHFMRLHRSPGAPFPSPFSLAHRDFIYLFITLCLSPGCLSSAST